MRVTEEEQDDTCYDRGEVTVEDSRECVAVTLGDGLAQFLAVAQFLFGTLEDKHVGVHRHTEGEHDTGDTGERQHRLQ